VVLRDRCCGSYASGIGDDQLISYAAVVLDQVARSFEHSAEGAHMFSDEIVCDRSSPDPAIKLGVNAIGVDDLPAMAIEQREYLPMPRGQAPRRASDHHHMSTPIDVSRSVEIVGEGDLLAASLAQRHNSSTYPLRRQRSGRSSSICVQN
jgi:hypothetical protein